MSQEPDPRLHAEAAGAGGPPPARRGRKARQGPARPRRPRAPLEGGRRVAAWAAIALVLLLSLVVMLGPRMSVRGTLTADAALVAAVALMIVLVRARR